AEPPPAGADDYAARTSEGMPLTPPTVRGDREESKPAADDPFERLRKAKERAKFRREEEGDQDRS
ncbi:MAG: hypothetical protein U0871_29335, partial [Gemmataceae bacterium]